MKIVSVLIEHATLSLDRPFTYLYEGEKTLRKGMRVFVRFGNQDVVGYIEGVQETSLSKQDIDEQFGMTLSYVVSILDDEPLLNDELLELAEQSAKYFMAPKIAVLQAMLPRSLRPSSSTFKSPKIAYETFVECLDSSEEGLTLKQVELLRLIAANGPILKKECGSPSVLEKLVEARKVRLFKKERQRFKLEDYEQVPPFPLTPDQQKAFDDILASDKQVILLQGVTGSGKTEVYLHLSDEVMKQGKTILMLVPEISLTPMMVAYFARRFQNKVAILHSGLTPAEKYDEYRRIARGEAQIVVGARSAVFAPLENIGLILIDEEHVESYKQDSTPYYHARDIAIMRGKYHHAKVILGSATPSLETKARARNGVYGYAKLEQRVHQNPLPRTKIIDLTQQNAFPRGSERLFSNDLLSALQDRLDKKEQAMLLINHRGYSSFIECSKCGHVFSCPSCQCSLTYHQQDEMLKCHRCGYVEQYPHECPDCHNDKLRRVGFGTERVVKYLQEHFPSARIARLDSDISKVRKKAEETLSAFKEGQYDFLVGTQMIAKGHDFPNVTLVGVLLADIGLSMPSYRSSENTFQLLTQVVGRAGRGDKNGEAFIQTYNPSHYAISLGASQDYERFYAREMQMRHTLEYPPFVYLLIVECTSKNEENAAETALNLKLDLQNQGFEGMTILGPSTPYFGFLNGVYKKRLIIKSRDMKPIKSYLEEVYRNIDGQNGVRLRFDVDPLDC